MNAPARTDFRQFGRPESSPSQRILVGDFIDRPTVYRLSMWWSGDLLYVGSTKNVGARLAAHARSQPWWNEVAAVSCEYFDTMIGALAAEAKAIRDERPRYNVAWR